MTELGAVPPGQSNPSWRTPANPSGHRPPSGGRPGRRRVPERHRCPPPAWRPSFRAGRKTMTSAFWNSSFAGHSHAAATSTPSAAPSNSRPRLLPGRVIVFSRARGPSVQPPARCGRAGSSRADSVRAREDRVDLRAGPRLGSRPRIIPRHGRRRRQQEGHQVARSLGPQLFHEVVGHDRLPGRFERFHVVFVDGRDRPLAVADVELVPLRAQDAEERSPVLQLQRPGDVIRIDGEAGLRDVAQDRGIVAMDQIRKVRPDVAALPLNAVALGARCGLAEERPCGHAPNFHPPVPAPSTGLAMSPSVALVSAQGMSMRCSGMARRRLSSFVQ